ncbi:MULTISPECIES: DUF3027 domain-containing protein [Actinoalloteichus]|nr:MULTISPECIES: DUF3027 domain-containing protein [Actinoalloteichus]
MSPSTPRFVPEPPSGQVGVDATSARLPAPALAEAVEQARAAAQSEAGEERVGEHVGIQAEDDSSATHQFVATNAGYVGWRWAVTVAFAGPGTPVTVSEVVLLPGPDALVAPEWLPWDQRVRAGDLGVGDLLPSAPDDPRLVPGYLASDDPAVEEVASELGLGRRRLLGRHGRVETARRWFQSDFGPEAQMARSAPAHCGTCGFYLPLAGSLRAAFGACGNEMAPADGRIVHAEYGCGAHSDAEVDNASPVPVAEVVFDDAGVELIPVGAVRTLDSGDSDATQAAVEGGAADESADAVAADVASTEVDAHTGAEASTVVTEPSHSARVDEAEARPQVQDSGPADSAAAGVTASDSTASADAAATAPQAGETGEAAAPTQRDAARPRRVRSRRGRSSAAEPAEETGKVDEAEQDKAAKTEKTAKPRKSRKAGKAEKAGAVEQGAGQATSDPQSTDDGGATT